ncbi:putative F-box protein At3g10430 [Cornus florida]|uniref:putative F-box protein At3g10430 n=1 Tax=Cornus florida TaxID=4283 RepID=UPI00289EFB00|nr:putative F-box protein At3g10430 [Cornus florida]
MASNIAENYIQEIVIVEILSRLTVKSLLRFRIVCKCWYTLVKNSNFISKHLHSHSNTRLLMQRYTYKIQKYALASFPYEKISITPSLFDDLDKLGIPRILCVNGPFHGIFCVWDRLHLALWNPSLKEFRSLLVPQPKIPSTYTAYCFYSGMGLDPITNHYKLVWIRLFWDEINDDPYIPTVIAIYTLNTHSWNLFEVDVFGKGYIHECMCNTYMDGVHYWLTSDDDNNYVLFSFDMNSEIFHETRTPPDIPKSQLGVLSMCNDYIAMFFYNPSEVVEKDFDIWLMKEEGSWTKRFTIGPFRDVDSPLGFWINGDVLFETGTAQLVFYYPDCQEIKYVGPFGNYCSVHVWVYKESLVAVKGENECWEEDVWSITSVNDAEASPTTGTAMTNSIAAVDEPLHFLALCHDSAAADHVRGGDDGFMVAVNGAK